MLAASFCLFALFFLAPALRCAGVNTPNSPLTVLVDFESPQSDTALRSMRQSLNRLLMPGGIDADIQLKQDLPENPQFGELVIFKMKGSCTMASRLAAHFAQGKPLALAYSSDGQVLHFGEVECDQVRLCLQSILGKSDSPKNQETYGNALAIVMAHEVYHMLGNAVAHTHHGLTKAALSASELAGSELSFPQLAIAALKKSHRR